MSSGVRLRWPSVRLRVAMLSGVMVVGFAVVGVVFLEDVLEELVGEVTDTTQR